MLKIDRIDHVVLTVFDIDRRARKRLSAMLATRSREARSSVRRSAGTRSM